LIYRYLPEQLHPTADAVMQFFRDSRGLRKMKIEEELEGTTLGYRPALHELTREGYYVSVDVKESPFSTTLEAVVSDCMQRSLPVKLFVAFPASSEIQDYRRLLGRAREKGVGVIEVADAGCQILYEALALSLIGVRPIDKKSFPPKFRLALSDAEATFRTSPEKGCSLIYDEIEALSRKIAAKTKAKGLWKSPPPGKRLPQTNLETGNWARAIDTLMNWLDWNKCGYLRDCLRRVQSVIPYRNESGHKPRTAAARIKRDRELKTRFEAASDMLRDLIVAARPLRL